MRKVASSTPLIVEIDQSSDEPLYRQIYRGIREAILSGRLRRGARVPSTRLLAADLGLARSTVVLAFEHLVAEGYLRATTSVGSRVADNLPDLFPSSPARRPPATATPRGRRALASRVGVARRMSLGSPLVRRSPVPFRIGEPALDAFPVGIWETLHRRRARCARHALLGYGSAGGFRPLRDAIAAHLGAARGVRIEGEQLLLVRGAQQAIDLVARTILQPGDAVWVEDPGYLAARAAFATAGAELIPVPVDEEGLNVAAAVAAAPDARAAYVAPSHQFPLGVTMSLPRRLALLEWAERRDSWIIEDDYDSDFRYAGHPLMSLQGLDAAERVLYIGTFSKTLFPALRLGFLAVPSDLVDAFARMQMLSDHVAPSLEQAVVADFITEGHFARHIRRMRSLYRERQESLLEVIRAEADDLLRAEPATTGMHLLAWLPEGSDDASVSREAHGAGIEVPPLSLYCMRRKLPPALLMGYGATSAAQSRRAARALVKLLSSRTRTR